MAPLFAFAITDRSSSLRYLYFFFNRQLPWNFLCLPKIIKLVVGEELAEVAVTVLNPSSFKEF
ncbi:hypothetical protein COLO4_32746 [Corchorus olitorius]|uniref:Uncharacterized protein n=1 Tax=Corchorus olitorius TaxID=93759 RepID=A0A1R3GYB9_9ROSI|nr:hypothetical protein COLO4_32746 [Corchorus olitorius]